MMRLGLERMAAQKQKLVVAQKPTRQAAFDELAHEREHVEVASSIIAKNGSKRADGV